MSRPETETGISVIPIEGMAEVLGTFNTEAYCLAYAATPTDLVHASDVSEQLRVAGAFEKVSPKTFYVGGLLKRIGLPYVEIFEDPEAPPLLRKNWVARMDTEVGRYALGLTGSLLDLSVQTNIPLRTILGEQRRPKDGALHSIESRLGILYALAKFDAQDTEFTAIDLYREVEELGIDYMVVKKSLRSLRAGELLDSDGEGKSRTHTLSQGDEYRSSTRHVIDQVMKRVALFAVASEIAIEEGTKKAHEILEQPDLVAKLAYRSYASSGHTGKHTR